MGQLQVKGGLHPFVLSCCREMLNFRRFLTAGNAGSKTVAIEDKTATPDASVDSATDTSAPPPVAEPAASPAPAPAPAAAVRPPSPSPPPRWDHPPFATVQRKLGLSAWPLLHGHQILFCHRPFWGQFLTDNVDC